MYMVQNRIEINKNKAKEQPQIIPPKQPKNSQNTTN